MNDDTVPEVELKAAVKVIESVSSVHKAESLQSSSRPLVRFLKNKLKRQGCAEYASYEGLSDEAYVDIEQASTWTSCSTCSMHLELARSEASIVLP